MIRFYCPDIEETPVMPEVESGHCVRVLRHQPGDRFEVVDGRGHIYKVELVDAHPKRAMVEIEEKAEVEKYWHGRFVLAVAPTKNMDRMEWLVEKATEIGLDAFVPLLCRNSERRDIKRERLEKTAVSAMKQSLKATVPEIGDMMPFGAFIEKYRSYARKYVAYCTDDGARRLLSRLCMTDSGDDTVVLIGPEGDFTPEEISKAFEAGFRPVSLGDARLRTETAALTALETLHITDQLKN